MGKFMYGVARFVRFIIKPFLPVTVFGPRKFEKRKAIVCGNHISGWDAVIFYCAVKNHIRYVYKSEFDKSTFLHNVFKGMGFIPIKRGEADIHGTRSCLEVLKNNEILGIFPEGTRNPYVDCLQEFKVGPALFAIKTKTPIRPFYIWEKHKAFRRNYVLVGQEFTLDKYYGHPITKEILQEATEYIRSKVDVLRIELNEILDKRGIKRRKRTKKELKKINLYEQQQQQLNSQSSPVVEDNNEDNKSLPNN